jgi:hypothetical protein
MRERRVLTGVLFLAAAMSAAVAQTDGSRTTGAAATDGGAKGPAGADTPAGIAGSGLGSSSDPGPSAAESVPPVPQSTIGVYDPTGGATLTGRSSETGSHPGTGTEPSGGDCLANSDNVLPGCPTENGPTR